MDRVLRSGNEVVAFFAALIVAASTTSVTAQQYCGDGSYAHAVQVQFDECGAVPDNVSVYISNYDDPLLLLSKAPSGYWEADTKTFDPRNNVKLCSPACSSAYGCAPVPKMIAINRGSHVGMCAARYVIHCTEPVWKLHVETGPGRWYVFYKRLRQTPGATEQEGGKMTPFDLCDLAYDEQVELQLHLQGIAISIP